MLLRRIHHETQAASHKLPNLIIQMLLSPNRDTNLILIVCLPCLTAGERLRFQTNIRNEKRRARGSASEGCPRTTPSNDINKHPMPGPATLITCYQPNERSHDGFEAIATNNDIPMDAGTHRRQSRTLLRCHNVSNSIVPWRCASQGFFCTCLGAARSGMWNIAATFFASSKSEILEFVFFFLPPHRFSC